MKRHSSVRWVDDVAKVLEFVHHATMAVTSTLHGTDARVHKTME